jgi:hydrogenase nickel incorporation protein HypA/HybF
MHEMGIAAEVARIASEEAERAGATRIVAMRLQVGRWSGVEAESLRFALEVLGEGTALAGCRVEIEAVEPTFACRACKETYPGRGHFEPCPHCGESGADLVAGDELNLAEIEVEDP